MKSSIPVTPSPSMEGQSTPGVRDREKAHAAYLDLIKRLDWIFNKIALNHFVMRSWKYMKGMVDKLYSDHRQFFEFVINTEIPEYKQAKNAIDTAVLATAVAIRLNLSVLQTKKLIEAALFHDVGMLSIPQKILNKPKALTNVERWYILSHPVQSYEIINKKLDCFEGVAQIALQHHESWNGEGYPKRLIGKEIEIEARIIAVVDTFVAMISERPYRQAMAGHQTMKNLLAYNKIQFDLDIVKTFVFILGLYPIGSLVELNNGAIAEVIDYWEGLPLSKPRVHLLTNTDGEACREGETIDLAYAKGLFIKKALDHHCFVRDVLAVPDTLDSLDTLDNLDSIEQGDDQK